MTWVYDQYLWHEWLYWPIASMNIMMRLGRWVYNTLAWLPRLLHELAHREPEKLLELVSALSALLMAVSGVVQIPISWKFFAAVVGVAQFGALVHGGRESRFVVMVAATVFWWIYMFALIPRRMTGYHIFLVPLCIAYVVNTFSLLHDNPKA